MDSQSSGLQAGTERLAPTAVSPVPAPARGTPPAAALGDAPEQEPPARRGRRPARVVLLCGPSGAGKSYLADASGLPVVALDDFYKEATDASLPQLPGSGGPDWDSPLSWDARAAVAALAELCRSGRTTVPVYDIPSSSRVGQAPFDLGEASVVVAEGIFAADIVAACREQGLLADALCLRGSPFTTFRRRLVRDLREGRKPPLYLVRRGLRLWRGERSVVARQVSLGARPCSGREAARRIASAAASRRPAPAGT